MQRNRKTDKERTHLIAFQNDYVPHIFRLCMLETDIHDTLSFCTTHVNAVIVVFYKLYFHNLDDPIFTLLVEIT